MNYRRKDRIGTTDSVFCFSRAATPARPRQTPARQRQIAESKSFQACGRLFKMPSRSLPTFSVFTFFHINIIRHAAKSPGDRRLVFVPLSSHFKTLFFNNSINHCVLLPKKTCVLNTIRLGMSNARIEATNNKIKLIIRKAYGFRNIDNMIDLIYLICSDLELPLPNRKCKLLRAA